MDEDTTDAAQAQQQQEEQRSREPTGWEWWPKYYDRNRAEHLAEMARLKALDYALGRIFGD
jgi:hypothetical protein